MDPHPSVYMDYAATTPVDPRVVGAMQPYFFERFGNAGSVHALGQQARAAVERARAAVALLIGAEPREIVFTAGATESNNAAILGTMLVRGAGAHVITVATEHHAVLEPCRWLEQRGAAVTVLPVDGAGLVDPDAVRAAVRPETALITVMHANNEIGTIGPVEAIAAVGRERGILVHTDATQSAGLIPLDVRRLGVDFLSLSAHKRYGPKGVGALYVRGGSRLDPFLHGGSQERGRRAGTENVPAIVGFGEAARIAADEMVDEATRIGRLRGALAAGLSAIEDCRINGHPDRCLPGIASVSFAGADSESLLLALDLEGVAASSGSACTSGSLEPSHVVAALGLPPHLANGTLRFSLGRWTSDADVDRVLTALSAVLHTVRGAALRARR